MLLERLGEDLKAAMKSRDGARVKVLRHVLAQLKNARIEKGDDLTDDEAIAVLRKGVKSRSESVELYRKGGREDLVVSETAEIAVLEEYLPQMLGGDALVREVETIIDETGASSMKDMGAVMKAVMAKHGSSVDGKEVQGIVRAKLGG
jgi:uncharacterized protein YqeY